MFVLGLAALGLLAGCGGGPGSAAPAASPADLTPQTEPFQVHLLTLSVSPTSITLPLHSSAFFVAMGEREDGSPIERTSASQWSVQGDPIGTVTPIGRLTAEAPGVALVTAEDHVSGLEAYSLVTVPAAP